MRGDCAAQVTSQQLLHMKPSHTEHDRLLFRSIFINADLQCDVHNAGAQNTRSSIWSCSSVLMLLGFFGWWWWRWLVGAGLGVHSCTALSHSTG